MNSIEKEALLTVSQLTRSIKTLLESKYRFIKITGEISNLRTPFSGHSYFTLKDDDAQIRAVLFKQQKRFNDLPLKDGQEVICFGRLTVYQPRGEYQIVVDSVELFGTGRLQIQFEQLKKRLADKGYFDAGLKKPLPPYPEKIVVISSPTGAAIHDFLKIVSDRRSPVEIHILPVRVQGPGAAEEIGEAIERANSLDGVDIIVLCRGGGSLEDLWAFNEELVATAIHQSRIPLVTGIGHETDFTIADFCSDYRCPTPTGVAETIVPDARALKGRIADLRHRLASTMHQRLDSMERQLQHDIRLLGNMESVFANAAFRLQLSHSYLLTAMEKKLVARERQLQLCTGRLENQAPTTRIVLQEKHLQLLTSRLRTQMERIVERKESQLSRQASLLNSVSPLATLARGYSVVRRRDPVTGEYQVIARAEDTTSGEELNILLYQGEIDCVVKKAYPEEKDLP